MPIDLSKSLVIGISSRALFDLEEANAIFENAGVEHYSKYQEERENTILKPGTGFRLVEAILALNSKVRGARRAEVVVMSRNSPATSARLFNSIQHYGLDIQRAVLSGGTPIARYLEGILRGPLFKRLRKRRARSIGCEYCCCRNRYGAP